MRATYYGTDSGAFRVLEQLPVNDGYIAETIKGVQAQSRPADRIVVVPNNCREDDATATVAAGLGTEVIELHGIRTCSRTPRRILPLTPPWRCQLQPPRRVQADGDRAAPGDGVRVTGMAGMYRVAAINELVALGIRWTPGHESFDVLRTLYHDAFNSGRNYEQGKRS